MKLMLYYFFHSAYRTDEGLPWVLPVVRAVEGQMVADATLNHEYLPVSGLDSYRTAVARLLLGSNSSAINSSRVSYIASSHLK